MFFDENETEALRLFVQGSPDKGEPLYRAVTKMLAEQPASGDGEVEFTAKVPEPLWREFKQRFPQYGASKWFINMALRAFLDLLRGVPENDHLIRRAIDELLQSRKVGV